MSKRCISLSITAWCALYWFYLWTVVYGEAMVVAHCLLQQETGWIIKVLLGTHLIVFCLSLVALGYISPVYCGFFVSASIPVRRRIPWQRRLGRATAVAILWHLVLRPFGADSALFVLVVLASMPILGFAYYCLGDVEFAGRFLQAQMEWYAGYKETMMAELAVMVTAIIFALPVLPWQLPVVQAIFTNPYRWAPIPWFVGGHGRQITASMPVHFAWEWLAALNRELLARGLPPACGPTGGKEVWDQYLSLQPGSQRRALDALLEATRELDFRYGTAYTRRLWENLLQGHFRLYP